MSFSNVRVELKFIEIASNLHNLPKVEVTFIVLSFDNKYGGKSQIVHSRCGSSQSSYIRVTNRGRDC